MSETTGVGSGEEGVPEGGMDPEDAAGGVAEITRRPAKLSAVLALVAAGISLLTALAGGGVAVGIAGLGVVLLGVAVLFGYSRTIDLGGLLLLVGIAVGAINGAATVPVLAGTVGAVVAWDLANFAFSVGYQLGRETRTERVEALHAAASAGVGVVVATLSFVVFRTGVSGLPAATVVVMLLAALTLLAVLRL